MDPDQTGSTLFASIFKFVSKFRQLSAADNFSRLHFRCIFFLGPLRDNILLIGEMRTNCYLPSFTFSSEQRFDMARRNVPAG